MMTREEAVRRLVAAALYAIEEYEEGYDGLYEGNVRIVESAGPFEDGENGYVVAVVGEHRLRVTLTVEPEA